METITYRYAIRNEGTIMVAQGWDNDGNLVTFAAEPRMLDGVPRDASLEVPSWAILSRAPAFEVIS